MFGFDKQFSILIMIIKFIILLNLNLYLCQYIEIEGKEKQGKHATFL